MNAAEILLGQECSPVAWASSYMRAVATGTRVREREIASGDRVQFCAIAEGQRSSLIVRH